MFINFLATGFPYLVIVLSFLAGVSLLFASKWGSAAYWLAVAAVNFAATYLIPRLG